MRVLLIGPGVNRKYGDRFYYSTARRMLNGFVRNGDFVLHVSDRDLADYALGFRPLGKHYARNRLQEIARHVKPHLIVLMLADLVTPETVGDLRRASSGVKVVSVELDPIAVPAVAQRFQARLDHCDAGFVTTGGDVLAAVAAGRRGYHIPNLIDPAIDDQLAYEATAEGLRYDVFFAGSQNKDNPQWHRALALQAAAPELSYCYAGAGKIGGLWGADFIAAQGASRIGLNLNRIEGSLYASDRMGQYLGNGLLLATDRASGYDRYFSDDEMIFFSSSDELAARIAIETGPGDPWRKKAQKAREKALTIMSNEAVCRFISSIALEGQPSEGWVF